MHIELDREHPEQQNANLLYSHCPNRTQFSQHQNNNFLLDLNKKSTFLLLNQLKNKNLKFKIQNVPFLCVMESVNLFISHPSNLSMLSATFLAYNNVLRRIINMLQFLMFYENNFT